MLFIRLFWHAPNDTRITRINERQCTYHLLFPTHWAQFNIIATVNGGHQFWPTWYSILPQVSSRLDGQLLARMTSFALSCLVIFGVCSYPSTYFPCLIVRWSLESIEPRDFGFICNHHLPVLTAPTWSSCHGGWEQERGQLASYYWVVKVLFIWWIWGLSEMVYAYLRVCKA